MRSNTRTLQVPGLVWLALTALAVAAFLTVWAFLPGSALADQEYSATLDGSQQVPSNGSSGTGAGTVVLNALETQALVSLSFSGLQGTQTEAHIHAPAPAGTNASIVFTLPVGNFSDEVWNLTPTDVQNIKDGLSYFNVHTDAFLAGELRGQILLIAVGGVAEFPDTTGAPLPATDSSSGSNGGLVAGLAIAATAGGIALGGAAWFARRRLIRN